MNTENINKTEVVVLFLIFYILLFPTESTLKIHKLQ